MSPALPKPRGWRQLFGWRRVRATAITCAVVAALLSLPWESPLPGLWLRVFGLGAVLLLVFGVLEQWPRQLPRWLARWALQVMGVGLAVPIATLAIYIASTQAGAPPFWMDEKRVAGFAMFTILGVLLAPWVALSALVKQREAWVTEQALAFELERSELARQALDARMRLLSAQVQPHFLFNTLANIQALVETGSARAPAVLQSLIDYLRAAVPRLDEAGHRLGQELEMVRAYLDLMQLRMPDRLQVAVEFDPGVLKLHCPPLTLLTLVENAVRHGIDPSEDGGRIELQLRREDGRCRVTVLDTGVGLGASGRGLGTGLKTLRERLELVFNGEVQLQLHAVQPHGVRVELSFPALEIAA
ncbi:sensor histidine kinase [Inhella proteolytica]|uniref:Histidine kinase n=1 Tax=Inhella proteolytica TaxID=2795029 RepID=A0A931NFV1_9BURK|nr:histidine kinase [Inhella proteolytica]MBH9579212.1 histidine kinase [Inhella proteolytica]